MVSNNTDMNEKTYQSGNNNQFHERIAQLEQNNSDLLNIIQDFNKKYAALQEKYINITQATQANIIESQNKWIQIVQQLVLVGNDFS